MVATWDFSNCCNSSCVDDYFYSTANVELVFLKDCDNRHCPQNSARKFYRTVKNFNLSSHIPAHILKIPHSTHLKRIIRTPTIYLDMAVRQDKLKQLMQTPTR